MSAQTKMAEIINYVSDKCPGVVLEKKWNRLLRDMSNEIEILSDAPELLDALEKIALGEGWQAMLASTAIAKAKARGE